MSTRGGRRRLAAGALVGAIAVSWLAAAGAQTAETAGMITEIKAGSGKVEAKAGAADWRPAAPLLTLRAGDQVRTAGDATAVVLLAGGRGAVRVSAATSPYTVAGIPAGDGTAQKARALLSASLGFLGAGAKEQPKAVLSTRGGSRPPEILGPRNGPVLPDALVFEWLGSPFSRYTVRVLDPSGIVLEKKGVVGARLAYPADAPALAPGVRYRLQVEALGQPAQEAWFELVDPARAAAVRADLAQLDAALGPGVSPDSAAAVRGGALAAQGLYHDARLTALTALARNPDDPALHMLLGNLYQKIGLPQLAAESFDEAAFLLSR
ncbi:MAG TPA: hypothetical protein VL086_11220 [Candidatus Nitrosotalea sp.]|nr:hypothetical protein [Candidatus Nitrosotalea sp.]